MTAFLPALGRFLGVGCMSGTSLDGLDLAAVVFEVTEQGVKFDIVEAETLPYPTEWQLRLAGLPQTSAEEFARTHVAYGHWQGRAIQQFIQKNGLQPDFVATHGHTIFHQPAAKEAFTTQIGDGETIAAYLPCLLVTQFRNKDVALGGQGAPLVPFGEKYLFSNYSLLLNLGGFANLTLNRAAQPLAFDLTACNLVLNRLAQLSLNLPFDPAGEMAASGTPLPDLLAQLAQLPYFRQMPPKSLGTEWLEAEAWPLVAAQLAAGISPADCAATWCKHVATVLSDAVRQHHSGPADLLITGGGRNHLHLLNEIRHQMQPLGIGVPDPSPTLTDFKEALIFAWLGLCVLQGRPNVLNTTTGSRLAAPCGSIHLPPR